ncbi:ABC transporter permease [Mucilaginibacter sp. L3T2-6]|uniref:ABC transporter permease n=1 Tax=Mucilaginibacter sp. L3T2-6 TaxID=3062491 RepID=UPI002676DE15|nr:ABC transporter permease [Mucilaginibacter sp. L3T2-6]MDO3642582.1 ABC transporter permease [Mucilaginibacter sp. L3T2-6]MDV6215022.1 ABC transporter permease [Mucilaginibacter sp. L3T2-6]
METSSIPQTSTVLKTLLRADFTTQWRNRRAVILTLIVPVIILMTWKPLIKVAGGPFVLSNSIVLGLIATGLMGYSNSIARDRDKGIFQRLRVAPVPSWSIMASRILVQLVMIILLTTAVFIIGNSVDKITLSPGGYIATYFTAIVGGAVYLSLGQMIVGRIKNPETVNATVRLVYFLFILGGMMGEIFVIQYPQFKVVADIIKWSPYGTARTILAAGMEPLKWNADASMALLATIGYAAVFAFLGIKWFKWNTK